jgi:hypothetical protein
MASDSPINQQAMLIYEHFCDLHILLGLVCILHLLKSMHALIEFAQSRDVFACDLVATTEVCQGDVYSMYYDQTSKFIIDNFSNCC